MFLPHSHIPTHTYLATTIACPLFLVSLVRKWQQSFPKLTGPGFYTWVIASAWSSSKALLTYTLRWATAERKYIFCARWSGVLWISLFARASKREPHFPPELQ
jgi:hypothetical protein